jgi:hypothetical protein
MPDDLELSRSKPPILRRVGAGFVLVAAAALAVWLVIGVIKTIVFFALIVAAVVAIAWAVKTLVW